MNELNTVFSSSLPRLNLTDFLHMFCIDQTSFMHVSVIIILLLVLFSLQQNHISVIYRRQNATILQGSLIPSTALTLKFSYHKNS